VNRPTIKRPKIKVTDSAMSGSLFMYFVWPFWAIHGGPKAPTDLGTIVLALIGLYGTQKAFNTSRETSDAKTDKEKRDESNPPQAD
jgi:hypothetical protein